MSKINKNISDFLSQRTDYKDSLTIVKLIQFCKMQMLMFMFQFDLNTIFV